MASPLLSDILTEQALADLAQYCRQHQCTELDLALACLHRVEGQLSADNLSWNQDSLLAQILEYKRENERLKQEKVELEQEKADLEILLENTTEHSDAVNLDMHSQALEAKQQVEEQFRLIAEATPVGILIATQEEGCIVYANAAASDILGLSPEALSQQVMSTFYADPEVYATQMALLSERRQYQDELRCLRANGKPFWGFLSLRPFRFKGEATILMALHDVTARKQAEEALRLAEEKYRSIFENALEGIYQSTPAGRYINVNPAMATIHGFSSCEDMLSSVTEINHQIYVDSNCRNQFKALIETQGHVEGFEYQIYRQDGTIRWVSENARTVCDSQGQLLYYEGIVHDITEQKQRESTLQRALEELRIEIDHSKRAQQVEDITQTDYFQSLQTQIDSLKWDDD